MKSTKKSLQLLIGILMTSLLFAVQASAIESEEIMAELEKTMQLTKEQWEALKPVIDEKSEDLKKGMSEQVDKGFAELERLSKQFEEMSKDAEKKFNEIMTSEEAMKMRQKLAEIDREALQKATDNMVANLEELLALTEEQAQKIEPMLKESFADISVMLKDFAEEGSKDWNEFKKDFEKVTKDLYNKVEETLDKDQMEKLEEYNEEQEAKIERILFKA